MTKVADKLSTVANKAIKGTKRRFDKHNTKIKQIVKKPIEKDADGWVKTARVTEKVVGVGGRVVADTVDLSAALILFLSKIFVKTSDFVLFDNKALDFMKKKYADKTIKKNKEGKDKKLSKFTKENPRVAAYLTWYLMLMTVIGSGVGYANKDKIKDAVKDKIENVKDVFRRPKQEIVMDQQSNVKDSIRFVSPSVENFAQDAWNAYGNEIVMGLPFFETFRTTPRVHSGESRYTYGPGITWVYTVDSKGNIHQNPCTGSWKDVAQNFTMDEMWNQCRLHCLVDVFGYGLKPAITGVENIDGRACIAICFAGYQTHVPMKKIAQAYASADTIQGKMDAFLQGVPKSTADGTDIEAGSLKRRWWCAAYAVGLVSSADFVSLPCDSYSKIDVSMVYRNGHFKYDAETIEYALTKAKTKQRQSVNDLLSESEMGRVAMQHKSDTYTIGLAEKELSSEDIQIEKSVKAFNNGMKEYNAGRYEIAVKYFTKAIQLDEDNMEAYSSLAQSYYKLGEKFGSMEYYQKCVDIVALCNKHMNQNKSRLYDSETKAHTYYNAGHAREQMAKLNEANGEINTAKTNYDKALKNYETALANAVKANIDTGVYDSAIARIKEIMAVIRKQAFNTATGRVKLKNKTTNVLHNIENGVDHA